MDKSPDAFRTISEVSEFLGTPAHVLRFWESRFPQIRPVKRAGGRRYYRPADVALLAGIKRLLHDDGVTIRGVQKILREQGVRHVAGLGGMAAPATTPEADIEAVLAAEFGPVPDAVPDEEPQAEAGKVEVQTAQVISLEAAMARVEARSAQLPLDLVPEAEPEVDAAVEEVPEAPFVEAEEEPLPEPIRLKRDVPATEVVPVEEPVAEAAATAPAPAEASAAEPATEAVDSSEQAVDPVGESTVAARLRQADRAIAAANREALVALRARIVDLRARLASGVRRRAK